MKTLYEILEVSETASKEIIEKAYKVLAKKYHPDLQPENEKAHAEKLMKEINEAYETLTDDAKRNAYDRELKAKREIEAQNASYNNREANNNYQVHQSNNYQRRDSETSQMAQEELRRRQEEIKRQQAMQEEYQRSVREDYERKYRQAYEGYLRSLGYKIKYKWTWENYKKFFITIISIIIICTIIWIFPPTHKMLVDLYESNSIIKTIVDIICNIFVSIGSAIKSAMNFGKSKAP